jgi:hypothetical protein
MSLKNLSETIWPTVIAEGLVTGQDNSVDWINLENGGEMINYLSEITSEKDYAYVVDSIKDQIRANKLKEKPEDPSIAKRYVDTLSKDTMAYDTIKKVFKKKELQKILKNGGKRKRNVFCWVVGTLLLEYVPATRQ